MSKQQNTPQYIKQVPWYAKNLQGVGQQINTPSFIPKTELQQWYQRGKKGYQATTYRKGACLNCGAMGHNKKQCTERPRKTCIKYDNKNIAPDDVVKKLQLNWEGKRDRWNGYQPEMYKQVIEQYEQFQEIRKKRRLQQGASDPDWEYKQTTDPLKLANLPTKHIKNQKYQGLTGVRNREDRAKYLNNLDLNGPTFDPKSRSMKNEDDPYSLGQLNNVQLLGQKLQLTQLDKFANEQVQKNNSDLSSISLPTLTEKIYKQIKQKNQSLNTGMMSELRKKYGVNLQNSLRPLGVIIEDDNYVDHQMEKILKKVVKSSYEEDVFINDHLAVWGSWYSKLLGWGYACCHSTDKMSYCMGTKGKQRAVAKQLKIKAQMLSQLDQIQQKQEQQEQNKQ